MVNERRTRLVIVVDRPEIEHREVDGIITLSIHPIDGVSQPNALPRRLATFVHVLVDKPIGLDFPAQLLFFVSTTPPVAIRRGPFRRKTFDSDQPLSSIDWALS